MHQDEAAEWLNHPPHVFARGILGCNRRANGDTAILGNFGGNIANTANVDVAVLLRKTKLGREMFPHEIAVEQRHRPAAHLEQFNHKYIGDRRFTCTGKTGEKYRHPLLVPRREGAPELARDFGKSEPGWNLAAIV